MAVHLLGYFQKLRLFNTSDQSEKDVPEPGAKIVPPHKKANVELRRELKKAYKLSFEANENLREAMAAEKQARQKCGKSQRADKVKVAQALNSADLARANLELQKANKELADFLFQIMWPFAERRITKKNMEYFRRAEANMATLKERVALCQLEVDSAAENVCNADEEVERLKSELEITKREKSDLEYCVQDVEHLKSELEIMKGEKIKLEGSLQVERIRNGMQTTIARREISDLTYSMEQWKIEFKAESHREKSDMESEIYRLNELLSEARKSNEVRMEEEREEREMMSRMEDIIRFVLSESSGSGGDSEDTDDDEFAWVTDESYGEKDFLDAVPELASSERREYWWMGVDDGNTWTTS